MAFDKGVYNVVITGISFMLVFTAFQTGSMIEQRVLETVKAQTKHSKHPFTGDGYTSLSIIYLVFAFANWIAAPIVAVIGPRISMIFGAIVYTGFIASFLYPLTWLLYVMSALLGVAAAVIWTAQGNYLTLNSTDETMGRNSGLFWALFQSSLLFGNLFVHFEFADGGNTISDSIRYTVYGVLSGTGVLGTLLMFAMRKPPTSNRDADEVINRDAGEINGSAFSGPWKKMRDELVTASRMLFTKDMALLFVGFFYTGIELTFFSGVYGTCISHTKQFGDAANSYIGISGMLIGAGEILGGLFFGILGSKTNKYGRDIIVLLGFLIHMVAFFLVFINLPDKTPIGVSGEAAYISPSAALALLCSFLLGFGDSCFNTQIYSILGVRYKNESGAAFSLFKFSQSLSAAIAFFYSEKLLMRWQLLILVVFAILGSYTFFLVEWSLHNKRKDYEQLPEENSSQTHSE